MALDVRLRLRIKTLGGMNIVQACETVQEVHDQVSSSCGISSCLTQASCKDHGCQYARRHG